MLLSDGSEIVRAEFLYRDAPTPSCHASTLSETRGGGLVAAWFGGTAESAPDVGIYVTRLENGAWTRPVEIAAGGDGNACYNPVLFQPRRGPLLLFYKVGRGPSTWWGMMTRSKNGGQTWETPTRLPEGIYGPIKNRPLELAGGELLCPSSTENDGWKIHMERTPDNGKTWTASPPLNDDKIGAIQPSLLKLGGRRLRAVGRTQQGRVFAIDSLDLGKTWGTMRLLDLPNPNSGTDAIRLKDGRFLMVYNHTTSGRTPLNVALSTDAEHWTSRLALEDQPGEYSYPTVVQTSDGLVHITYTWHRTRIRHVVVDPSRLAT